MKPLVFGVTPERVSQNILIMALMLLFFSLEISVFLPQFENIHFACYLFSAFDSLTVITGLQVHSRKWNKPAI